MFLLFRFESVRLAAALELELGVLAADEDADDDSSLGHKSWKRRTSSQYCAGISKSLAGILSRNSNF